jgi:plasmid maintenance system antidote protein VapI
MKSVEILRRESEHAEKDPEYVYERLVLDVNEAIVEAMESAGLKRADLAERLGTSRAYVTRLLGGPENLTLRTLVKVGMALDSRVEVSMLPATGNYHRAEARPTDWNIVQFQTRASAGGQEGMYAIA